MKDEAIREAVVRKLTEKQIASLKALADLGGSAHYTEINERVGTYGEAVLWALKKWYCAEKVGPGRFAITDEGRKYVKH